ncbi:MAG: alpha/beta hydrolase [Beijerinckiaceae bacterium]|nr:alpha/beta hydrolase [Beijerinckiaceae bacterium]MCZ8300894.1 alpha/beta hydrolase [Beijerinckiaceae bacterium]
MLEFLAQPPEGVPFPDRIEIACLRAADGIGIRAAFALPDGEPTGTVILLQGRAEYIEKYGEVFSELLARRLAVAALDWRGQGGSDRQVGNPRKGHVEDFNDYLLDLDALLAEIRRRGLPEPFHLLAHSTGGAIALLALARQPALFTRAILSSPLVAIAGLRWPDASRVLARLLASLGLSTAFIPGGRRITIADGPFEGNPLTSDPERFARMALWQKQEPRLAIGDPTIGWVDAAFEAMARFEDDRFGLENRTPCLFVLAGADRVVDSRAAAALARRMRGTSAITLLGAQHEILMERGRIRQQFWAAFDAFCREPVLGDAALPERGVEPVLAAASGEQA